ncbi:PREDICTED: UBX domain-containing protein 6-like isoform X1 [Amphimedon queenslandica]|uniref:PUB domain-containing protein n=1 Tax=Amphimedon queenslandica TaxID=400682 RepID=A0A1X7VJM0_AMPQE|nr:PREDICTED: UBX domain-containing protein 6-like isoform X1 [Amphimedon queenslandica]|eukprot:XP_019864518.1 PREDICTED: UBX domain-containing protein 6-like isoform X1 [Amphimedon queenslandica]
MADKVKEFFQKKKLDYKFSKAGTGHTLHEEKSKPLDMKDEYNKPPPKRQAQSSASATAGAAAVSRLEKGGPVVKSSRELYKDYAAMSQESKASATSSSHSPIVTTEIIINFCCAICKKKIPENQIHCHIQLCLQEEYIKEPLSSSVHMIHTLCRNEEQKKLCIDTISRYLDNIINNPTEVKFRKIRVHNKNFQEKVLCVIGSDLFLKAIGFQLKVLPFEDGETSFFVLSEDVATKTEELTAFKQLLVSASPLKSELDRNSQLFIATSKLNQFDLPDSFYNMSIEEIKKEQKLKSAALEKESMLRTKAMRERDEIKSAMRYYKFVVIRIRFPEGVILQGIFWPFDKFSEVRQFVLHHLIDPTRLYSLTFLQKIVSDDAASLAQLGMAPAAVLNLSWTDKISCGDKYDLILKPDIVQTIKEL